MRSPAFSLKKIVSRGRTLWVSASANGDKSVWSYHGGKEPLTQTAKTVGQSFLIEK